MKYEFTVPGEAKTERKRQRFGKSKTGAIIGHRTDEPDREDFKARIAFFAQKAISGPLSGPLHVQIEVCKPKPESWPVNPTTKNPWPGYWWVKPDADNYIKIISDALNKIAWKDDAQIVRLVVNKVFAEKHETRVVIFTVDDPAQEVA